MICIGKGRHEISRRPL